MEGGAFRAIDDCLALDSFTKIFVLMNPCILCFSIIRLGLKKKSR